MATKFSELRNKMTPEARAKSAAIKATMVSEMPINELRKARGLSQANLAVVLHTSQAAVSKLERRTDMYVSTLRSHIQAMGGELDVIARFPDGEVKITNFADDFELDGDRVMAHG